MGAAVSTSCAVKLGYLPEKPVDLTATSGGAGGGAGIIGGNDGGGRVTGGIMFTIIADSYSATAGYSSVRKLTPSAIFVTASHSRAAT